MTEHACREDLERQLARTIASLRERCDRQAAHIAANEATAHAKNLALDAMGWVWCNGGCKDGVHRYSDREITEEVVQMYERNATRLRGWWTNRQHRLARESARTGASE